MPALRVEFFQQAIAALGTEPTIFKLDGATHTFAFDMSLGIQINGTDAKAWLTMVDINVFDANTGRIEFPPIFDKDGVPVMYNTELRVTSVLGATTTCVLKSIYYDPQLMAKPEPGKR